jgi:phosphoribosylglycinamide formyltransferase 1
MSAIVKAVKSGRIPDSEIAVVISDKPSAIGLLKATELGIETVACPRNGRTREQHDAEIIAELRRRNVEFVCLAGYMRLLSADFVKAFPNKIINIHPSLLPAFAGLDSQKQAVDYGVRFSGCTVHLVDELLDHGAIIAQKVVEVFADDTAEKLSARILEHEHELYIEALTMIVSGNFDIIGRKFVINEELKIKN